MLADLIAHHDLSAAQTAWAMDQVMRGEASPVVLAGFLTALATKGETVEELRGLADAMLAHALPIDVPPGAVDIVGTGGDRLHTVNISTMASLVIAAGGVGVVKHGNRASSSSSGSADVLEALGVDLDLPVERVAEVYRQLGITFCFATVFHPSFRHAVPTRRELAVGTAFNVLGPLTNPARPRAAAIGVADARTAPLVAGVLAGRGTSALVFRGRDNGLDELSATGVNQVWEVRDGVVTEHAVDAVADLGLAPATVADLRGRDAAYNADVARGVLAGQAGPVREAVLLNAAAAFVADGSLPGTAPGPGLVERLRAGLGHAARAVDSGAAAALLERWVALTR
ncbi:anthranilate phosphoribosyltransferase [Georgenia sp. TF02-10]|uniref:anthranilate phosphoribosyltransferase n=1 Tax=Georgenia sp. TF02-10 TaxID=2917725 RepID=UPI001FA74651|nr:anthranilate phosphoribosyltransferase [Georgenia sp. TF02-10]UNX56399.1 anthranilate phosphoribosyltransferase [Georgenia sp. TF02-10]